MDVSHGSILATKLNHIEVYISSLLQEGYHSLREQQTMLKEVVYIRYVLNLLFLQKTFLPLPLYPKIFVMHQVDSPKALD